MEGGKIGAGQKRTAPGTGGQYLAALMKCADWISTDYKSLAAENMADVEFLKELYMCACDGVPVELAIGARKEWDPQAALHLVRMACIRDAVTVRGQDDEEEKRNMGFAEPGFFAMFPENQGELLRPREEDPFSGKEEGNLARKAEERPYGDVSEKELRQEERFPWGGKFQEGRYIGNFLRKMAGRDRGMKVKGKKITRFMEECLNEGYDKEQLEYFLECMEKGMTPREIKRAASPKLPVEVMRRLHELERRKGNG